MYMTFSTKQNLRIENRSVTIRDEGWEECLTTNVQQGVFSSDGIFIMMVVMGICTLVKTKTVHQIVSKKSFSK